MFVITKEWLTANTPQGGYNLYQFTVLGVRWPTERNWKLKLLGRSISEKTKADFERGTESNKIKVRMHQGKW